MQRQISNDSGKKAEELFKDGLNCSQAVLCAHATEVGLDAEFAKRLAAPLGGGVGRMREVCGAFTACAIIAGLKCPEKSKQEMYKTVQSLAEKFKQANGGSIVCRELLGLSKEAKVSSVPQARTADYYKKRPCAEIVRNASAIIADFIGENSAKL